MTALIVILSIIALIVLVLSVKITVVSDYEESFTASVKVLFFVFNLYPFEIKPKKNKKNEKKTKKEKEEKPDKNSDRKKSGGENMFVRFYNNVGFEGVLELIHNAGNALSGMFKRLGRALVFERLFVKITVSSSDSAATAVKYGRVCSYVFPSMGYITSAAKVKKYDFEVIPDFITGKNSAQFHINLSFRPIRIINALIIVAFEFLFKVVIKFIKGSKPKAENKTKETQLTKGETV
ncbi:MAG: hypothetical protein K6B52_07335 [Clostridiales bacterium]|nr:hypothetical protein [Clostridiales bacterium]